MPAWTPEQLAALREARATGALTVRFADRQVTYRSDAEMKALEAEMVAAIEGAAGAKRRTKMVRFTSSTGW